MVVPAIFIFLISFLVIDYFFIYKNTRDYIPGSPCSGKIEGSTVRAVGTVKEEENGKLCKASDGRTVLVDGKKFLNVKEDKALFE